MRRHFFQNFGNFQKSSKLFKKCRECSGRLNRAHFMVQTHRFCLKNGRLGVLQQRFVRCRGELSPICFFNVSGVGECFAPLPDRLGRFTSGQELQVKNQGPTLRTNLAASNGASAENRKDLDTCYYIIGDLGQSFQYQCRYVDSKIILSSLVIVVKMGRVYSPLFLDVKS
jgi:hypothetical protein